MSRVGILSFSDGRDFVHQGIAGFVAEVEARIVAACNAAGYEVALGTSADHLQRGGRGRGPQDG